MIAKAVIEEKLENKFRIRIPLFESSGGNSPCLLTATLCYVPGNLDCYNIGDVVFVSFENNQISSPVILGKLYTGPDSKTTNLNRSSILKADTEAQLPKNTSIGEFSSEEVYSTFKKTKIYEDRITDLEQKMNTLINVVTNNSINLEGLIDYGQATDEDIEDLFEDDPEDSLNQSGYETTNDYDVTAFFDEDDYTYDDSTLQAAVSGTDYGLVDDSDIEDLYSSNYDIEEVAPEGNPENNLNNTSYDSTSNTDIAKLYEDTSSEQFDQSEVLAAVEGTNYGLVSDQDIENMYTNNNEDSED